MGALELVNVKKSFGAVDVIGGVSLKVDEGEFVTFVGPSGSGKSTLLRMIAGLEAVDKGVVRIGQDDVTFNEPSDRGIAMVFQSYALYPHMNVAKNISFNLELAGVSKSEINKRVKEAAQILRIEPLLDRMPSQLSGGQRQRVAIGRAIVRKPKIFLFDEPLSNLDAALRVQMRLEIERLHKKLKTTMIYVTHDQVEAMTLSDRIVALEGGAIRQVGSPLEMYRRPRNTFVAGFIGSPKMNFFKAKVAKLGIAEARVELANAGGAEFSVPAENHQVGNELEIGVRPEALKSTHDHQVSESDISIPVTIETIERLGNITYGYADAGDGNLITVQYPANSTIDEGAQDVLTVSLHDLYLFDSGGQSRPVFK